jgi:hypothetical protein
MRKSGLTTALLGAIVLIMMATLAQSAETAHVSVDGVIYSVDLERNSQVERTAAPNSSVHYRGILQDQPGAWARLSLIGQRWTGLMQLYGQLYHIDQDASPDNGVLVAKPIQADEYAAIVGDAARNDSVAAPAIPTQSKQLLGLAAPRATLSVGDTALVADLQLILDHFFMQLHGNEAIPLAQSVLNEVDGIFSNQLNVTFNMLDIISYDTAQTDPINDTLDAATLLSNVLDLRNQHKIMVADTAQAQAQLDQVTVHLLTTRNLLDTSSPHNGKIIGLSYTPALCDTSSLGLSQDASTLSLPPQFDTTHWTAITLAHELGHNFGAKYHDGEKGERGEEGAEACPTKQYLMSGDAVDSSQFSSCSLSQIQTYFASGQVTCLRERGTLSLSATASVGVIEATRTLSLRNNTVAPVAAVTVNGQLSGDAAPTFTAVASTSGSCSITSGARSYVCDIGSMAQNAAATVNETIHLGGSTALVATAAVQTSTLGINVDDVPTEFSPAAAPQPPATSSSHRGGALTEHLVLLLALLPILRRRACRRS